MENTDNNKNIYTRKKLHAFGFDWATTPLQISSSPNRSHNYHISSHSNSNNPYSLYSINISQKSLSWFRLTYHSRYISPTKWNPPKCKTNLYIIGVSSHLQISLPISSQSHQRISLLITSPHLPPYLYIIGVYSDTSYDVPLGLIYSFPVTCCNGYWKIVQGMYVNLGTWFSITSGFERTWDIFPFIL